MPTAHRPPITPGAPARGTPAEPGHHRPLPQRGPPPGARRLRHVLLWGSLWLLATGAAWLVLQTWFPQVTPFGTQPHPAAAWLMRAHGALAWLLAVAGGAVVHAHARAHWARRHLLARHRVISGLLTTLTLAVLLLSAIALQYAPEAAHATASLIHWTLGLTLSATALLHRRR